MKDLGDFELRFVFGGYCFGCASQLEGKYYTQPIPKPFPSEMNEDKNFEFGSYGGNYDC